MSNENGNGSKPINAPTAGPAGQKLAVRVTRVVVEIESSGTIPEEHSGLALNAAFLQGIVHLVTSVVGSKASISPVAPSDGNYIPIIGAPKKYLALFSSV